MQERISSFDAGSIQRSQSPARAKTGEPSAAVKRCGCLPSASSVHSKNPPAGIMQRRRLKDSRNIGFSATVSARALNVAGTSLRLLFQKNGIRPQRIETSSRCPPPIETDHVDIRGRRDVVARAQVARRPQHGEKRVDLFPGVILCETSAHGGYL